MKTFRVNTNMQRLMGTFLILSIIINGIGFYYLSQGNTIIWIMGLSIGGAFFYIWMMYLALYPKKVTVDDRSIKVTSYYSTKNRKINKSEAKVIEKKTYYIIKFLVGRNTEKRYYIKKKSLPTELKSILVSL